MSNNLADQWHDYTFFIDDQIASYFSKKITSESRILYILGDGFDIRMCDGVEHLLSTEKATNINIWKVMFNEGINSPSRQYYSQKEKNNLKLHQLISEDRIIEKRVDLWVEEGNTVRFVGEVNTNKMIVQSRAEFAQYSDIIIDISALPTSIYICLLNKILDMDINHANIYVFINENYETDRKTKAVELGEFAHEIHGLSHRSTDIEDKSIWFPILGEINTAVLQKYYDYLSHSPKHIDEACPVLPLPSIDPRRGDKIINEYRQQLFSQFEVDKKNIMYASEINPFQVYRELVNAAKHYQKVLKPIGDCEFIFSVIASKLMTVGTFLAAYDLKSQKYKVSFLNITNRGYIMSDCGSKTDVDNKLYCLCLSDGVIGESKSGDVQ